MERIWTLFLHNRRFATLVLLVLILAGAYAVFSIPKESAPEVQVPVGIVTTSLPGASAEDIETLVTDEIEQQLRGSLDELETLTSQSRQGVSSITAEFAANADIDQAIDDLSEAVDRASADLPAEATDPRVSEVDFSQQPVITAAVTSDRPAPAFADLADTVEDELLATPGVSDVGVGGKRERQVRIIVDQQALAGFNLTLTDVTSALSQANAALPAGTIQFDGTRYSVALEAEIDRTKTLADVAVGNRGGEAIQLRDVASIADTVTEETTRSRVSEFGEPAQQSISFNVFKQSGGNIASVAAGVRDTLDNLQAEGRALADSAVVIVQDMGEQIAKDLTNLSTTGLQTMGLVMLLLFLTLGWREAIVAGLAIPLSFTIGFLGLLISGNTLNFISLFALILSVGILVDSAIVMVEGIHTHMKEWMDKEAAARRAIAEYHAPLTAGTLTTVAVFAPLLIVSGVTGEFIASIPFTIIFVLLASLVVALGFIPLIATGFLRRRTTSRLEEQQEHYTHALQQWYRRLLGRVVGSRRRENALLASVLGLFILALALPITGLVPSIFFPQEDVDRLTIQVEEPVGTTLGQTDLEVRKVEEVLYDVSAVESFVTTIGQSGTGGMNSSSDPRFATIILKLRDDRVRTSSAIVADLRERFSDIRSTQITINQPNNGPPTGDPVSVRFVGGELSDLADAANIGANILRQITGTTQVETSAQNAGTEIAISVDRREAAAAGVSMQRVAQTVRTAITGTDATTIRSSGTDIEVNVVANLNPDYQDAYDTNRVTPTALRQIAIPTRTGDTVSLGSISDIALERQSTVIQHRDRERVETVSSEVTGEATANQVLSEFRSTMAETELPAGVRVEYGGETQESQEAFQEMFIALILGLFSMFGLLVLQFDSYRYAAYVLSVIPFALIGIFFGFAGTGTAISFPSMMGFIALAGIVVNNSIILVDRMRYAHRQQPDASAAEIACDAAVSRLRPVLLTTITTVIGVAPLLFSSALWAPLAQAIMFGLAFAVVLTLFFVPVLYARWPGTAAARRGQ